MILPFYVAGVSIKLLICGVFRKLSSVFHPKMNTYKATKHYFLADLNVFPNKMP
jgi:hypothetical protein